MRLLLPSLTYMCRLPGLRHTRPRWRPRPGILDGLHGLDKQRHLLPLGLDGAQCWRHHIHGGWLLQVPATRCEPKEPSLPALTGEHGSRVHRHCHRNVVLATKQRLQLIHLLPLHLTESKTGENGALGFKKPGQNHKVGKMKAKSQLDFTTRVKTPMSLFLFGNLVTNFFFCDFQVYFYSPWLHGHNRHTYWNC
jgi:hypothetical protein